MSLPQQPATNPYAASLSPSTAGPFLDRRIASSYGQTLSHQHVSGGSGAQYGGSSRHSPGSGVRVGRIIKRLFQFPQMDFEVAVWEMLNLMIAPRKVWRQVWYRKRKWGHSPISSEARAACRLKGNQSRMIRSRTTLDVMAVPSLFRRLIEPYYSQRRRTRTPRPILHSHISSPSSSS